MSDSGYFQSFYNFTGRNPHCKLMKNRCFCWMTCHRLDYMASIIRIIIETFHVPLKNCPFDYALIRNVQKARLFYYCPFIAGASKPGRASPQRLYRLPTERLRSSTVCHPRKCGGCYWTVQGVISRVVQVNFKDSMQSASPFLNGEVHL